MVREATTSRTAGCLYKSGRWKGSRETPSVRKMLRTQRTFKSRKRGIRWSKRREREGVLLIRVQGVTRSLPVVLSEAVLAEPLGAYPLSSLLMLLSFSLLLSPLALEPEAVAGSGALTVAGSPE